MGDKSITMFNTQQFLDKNVANSPFLEKLGVDNAVSGNCLTCLTSAHALKLRNLFKL